MSLWPWIKHKSVLRIISKNFRNTFLYLISSNLMFSHLLLQSLTDEIIINRSQFKKSKAIIVLDRNSKELMDWYRQLIIETHWIVERYIFKFIYTVLGVVNRKLLDWFRYKYSLDETHYAINRDLHSDDISKQIYSKTDL